MSGKLLVLSCAIFQIISPVTEAQQREKEYDVSTDYVVYHYSNGYYTRWEAEDTTENLLGTGLKANYGSNTTYDGTDCWTTGNEISNSSRIVLYGPQYRQDKVYKLGYLADPFIAYELKFSLAGTDIIIPQDYSPRDSVCKVSIVFSYKIGGVTNSIILAEKTIRADSIFSSFTPFTLAYCYPDSFCAGLGKMPSPGEYKILNYNDSEPGTGVQFQFTWYGKKQLYIDKFEVYDKMIGNDIVNFPELVADRLKLFSSNYIDRSNLKYISEPKTLDNYTPMRFVDSILGASDHPTGIAEFYPQWIGWRNVERTIEKLRDMANPQKIMREYMMFDADEAIYKMFEYQRQRLHEIYPCWIQSKEQRRKFILTK